MKALLFTGLAVLTPVLCQAATPTLKLVAEIKGFANPESVATDGVLYYVSNLGAETKPTAKDGDGFISRMGLGGEDLEPRFIEGLHAPKGMLVLDGVLYVCDIDTLYGFELASRTKIVELSFAKEGVEFLNDVCAAPGGRLFVSATDKNKIYLVDPKESEAKPVELDQAPNGPNGLAFLAEDEGFLLVAEWGDGKKPTGLIRAYQMDGTLLKGTRGEEDPDWPVKPGLMDGLALYVVDGQANGLLYSDWGREGAGGRVLLMGDEDVVELPVPGKPLGGPADFHYNPRTGLLALPCMLDNRVLLVQVIPAKEENREKAPAGEGE